MKCECNGLIKPDVVFFGEGLPKEFAEAFDCVAEADLVIIMGTSLVVFPFAFLAKVISNKTPVVLINNTDSRVDKRVNSLWLDGSLDERLKAIAGDLKWEL
jgi:NAD-dependent histone deacetylase SIR2